VPPAIGVLGCSSALLLPLIDLYISVIKSNIGISFVVSYSGSGITSGNNNCVIGVSIGLIGRYLNIILYVEVDNIILS
jgi:hypothetical protein